MATPNEISEASPCFSCIEGGLPELLYLLNQIRLNGGGAAMTPGEISIAAACFTCISDVNASILYLLNAIMVNGGGGGGTSNNISGAGSPVGVVTPDAINQFYRDTTGTALWQSTGLTNADWIEWA